MDLAQILTHFGGVAVTVAAFLLALSIIVAIHEYGHYIVGRWSGIHAEVFSLGFGPPIWSRMDRRGTRWQVAALPLGGYVKFLGDANAASVGGVDDVAPADRRRTMLGAPLWARAATVAAGPIFNFLFAAVIFAIMAAITGQTTDPVTVAHLRPLPASFGQGIAEGDEILAVNGIAVSSANFADIAEDASISAASVTYTVRRDGTVMDVQGPPPVPPVAGFVVPQSAANDAGLQSGDVIVAVDGRPATTFLQLRDAAMTSNGAPLALRVWRDGAEFDVTLTPRRVDRQWQDGSFTQEWQIGLQSAGLFFDPRVERLGPVSAIALGAEQTWLIIVNTLKALGAVVTGQISPQNLSGAIGMAEVTGSVMRQGIDLSILFVANLSVVVGLMNLFPIPVLDGGHLVFHAYEAIFRRRPSDRAVAALMYLGIVVILGVMVFALGMDIRKLWLRLPDLFS